MKVCFKCNIEKPETEFYKHPKMADGHLGKCIDCTKSDVRKHRAENDSVRDYDLRRYQERPDRRAKTAETTKRWIERNPDGYKAHCLVSNAIRSGKLLRQPCEVCGEPKTHAHHDDYSKPLDVRWLCVRHHALRHASERMK